MSAASKCWLTVFKFCVVQHGSTIINVPVILLSNQTPHRMITSKIGIFFFGCGSSLEFVAWLTLSLDSA
jgi:hypothetical protein